MSSDLPDIYVAIRPVIAAFQTLGIPYHIGGSVASSALGIARTTVDVDLVADVRQGHAEPLVESLQSEYYIDGEMIAAAAANRASFNLVHLSTMIKVDVFVPKSEAFAQESFSRRRLDRLEDETADEVFIATAEDLVLHKLDWFRKGGEVAERQWNDVLGILNVQKDALDTDYMRQWARELGLSDLLDKAFDASRLS